MFNSGGMEKKKKARKNSDSSSDDEVEAERTKNKGVKEQNSDTSSSEEEEERNVRKRKETPNIKDCSEKTEAKTSKKMGKQSKEKEKNSSNEEGNLKVSSGKKYPKASEMERVKKKNINKPKKTTLDQRSFDVDDAITRSQFIKVETPFNMTYDRVKISENSLNGNDKDYQAVPRMYVLERFFKPEKALNDEEDVIKAEFSILFFAFLERIFNEGKYFLKDFTKVMMREKPVLLFNDLNAILKNNELLEGGVKRWWTKLSNKLNNREEGDLKRMSMAMVLKEEGALLKETNEIISKLLTETIAQKKCKDRNKLSIFSKLFLIKINIYQGIETKSYVPDKLTKDDSIPPETIFEYPLALVHKKAIFSLLYTEEDKYLFNVENNQPIKEEVKIPKNQQNDSLIDNKAIVESMGEVVDAVNLMTEGLYDIAIRGKVNKFELGINSWNRLLVTIKGLPEITKNSISWKIVDEKVKKLNEILEYYRSISNEFSKLRKLISTWKDEDTKCRLCGGNSNNESKVNHHYHETCLEVYFITLSFRLQTMLIENALYKDNKKEAKKEVMKEVKKDVKKEEEKPAREEKNEEGPSCKCGQHTTSTCKKCNSYICASCMMKYIKY